MSRSSDNNSNRSAVITSVAQLDRTRAMMLALPVPMASRLVPWGYRISPKDPKMLEPIDEYFKLLYAAKIRHLKVCSYGEVAAWLTAKTGCKITDEGLTRIMTRRSPDRRVLLPLKERLKHDVKPVDYR